MNAHIFLMNVRTFGNERAFLLMNAPRVHNSNLMNARARSLRVHMRVHKREGRAFIRAFICYGVSLQWMCLCVYKAREP